MSNYKIRVANEAESKEVQGLFVVLGYMVVNNIDCEKGYIVASKNAESPINFDYWHDVKNIITIQQLRDLVVLKRNDVNDRNVTDPEPEYSANLYLDSKGDLFVFHNPTQTWKESNLNGMDSFYKVLKPIAKEPVMKEYLNKLTDGTYKLVVLSDVIDGHDVLIEIPEGAESFNYFGSEGNVFFLKNDGEKILYSNENENWSWQDWGDIDFDGVVCLWQRHTQPEELPFVDDEPSLNDQYAEIEQVRQSAYNTQIGGSHYKNLAIQPMEYALKNKLDYAQANVVKYVTRHALKGGKDDLLKAIHNIELMIEYYYGE